MRPGGAVVEIGFQGGVWSSVFFPFVLSCGHRYYVSFAKGAHGTPMKANVGEVVELVKKALGG